MKSLRFVLSVVLMSLATVAFAQSDAHKMAEPKAPAPKSEAQTSFDAMKTLAGDWEGPVKTDMPVEAKVDITPLDPAKYDHPVTMLYVDVDADRLTLVHYCDAGNRPRMTGKISPDGKTLAFDFADLSGRAKDGRQSHSVFTIIDANHHTEDWTYMLPGGKPVHAHFDLQRTK